MTIQTLGNVVAVDGAAQMLRMWDMMGRGHGLEATASLVGTA